MAPAALCLLPLDFTKGAISDLLEYQCSLSNREAHMTTQITLTCLSDDSDQKRYDFTKPGRYTIGRAVDCDIQLPSDFEHAEISRHHCAFEIDPPTVRVCDLDSCNGTFVNGELIGQRQGNQTAEEATPRSGAMRELKHGDEVRVGHEVFRVDVFDASDLLQPIYFG